MELFSFFVARKVIHIAYSDSFHAKKISTEKNSSNTNLFATLAHVKILFTSYVSVSTHKIWGFARKNMENFAGNFSWISLMLLWKPAKLSRNPNKNLKK